MEVEKKQFEDTDAPEQAEHTECSYFYSGFNFTFSDQTNQLSARVYDDEPGIAHIQSWRAANQILVPTTEADKIPGDNAFFRAVLYHLLQKENCNRVDILTRQTPPYQKLELARFDVQPKQG